MHIEVYDEPPAVDDSADLLRDGQLKVPGGFISVPQSLEETFQRGLELPDGPGTYGVRVCGYGRNRARQLREEGAAPDGPGHFDAIVDALAGVERYRICLWQVSSEPRWEDDEDE
ncbi:hypothetical protein AB0368_23380 [Actinoplanes sp. NPDC051475]|uniref:hypothetical protein n=1 Tax=Actinoplanes sp. NPDC051475 TaxID=3157225 RepID=UPI00344EA88B